jgi:hypothetical protein
MKPKLILCLALILSGGLFGCSTVHDNQLSVTQREQVKRALATLKPGMTQQQVMDTLSKTPWKQLECIVEGGGSQSYSWHLYSTENAANLLLVFNGTTNPPQFVKYELCGDGWKTDLPLRYHNAQYDLTFYLPESWKCYLVLTDEWNAPLVESPSDSTDKAIGTETGPIIVLRNPLWRTNNLYQDIPIMVFTYKQWKEEHDGLFFPYAGGVIDELWHNQKYVFGLFSRYNADDDIKGWQETDDVFARNRAIHPEPTLFTNP